MILLLFPGLKADDSPSKAVDADLKLCDGCHFTTVQNIKINLALLET